MISASVLALLTTPLALAAGPAQAADPVDVQIIGTNDFHGRLLPGFDFPGAAEYAGALNQLRAENPNTIFAAAGDLIGASTFESFIQHDKPTIDVMNEMGLDVSATGNHEFDQGYDDLVNRVMAPYDATTNPEGGAQWQYIAANVDEPGGADLIPPTWTEDRAGITVGFVGAVTEDLPSLVSPDGIAGLTVNDIVDSVNAAAADLTADGADVVVMLVHEGAPGTECASMQDPSTTWGNIVTGVSADVDAIVSGHTHLQYDCEFPVAGLGFPRPVVSAGQYGAFLDKLIFSVDPDTGDIAGVSHSSIDVFNGGFSPDPEVQAIVDQAEADAEGPGSVVLGEISAAFNRARRLDSGVLGENRGGESTLGNEVAEAQRWATSEPAQGAAQIAFMNPGGLRANMDDTDGNGFPEPVTYKEAAVVQPFANTLVNMDMTGAQIKTLLEQQWQRDADGNVPTRPFLKLGVSEGFKYEYDFAAPEGQHIGRMWLNGEEIEANKTYSVTANSFLAAGGDNFRVFREAANKRDTGKIDLEAMVDYMAEFASDEALSPDYAQRAVGVSFPNGDVVKPHHRLVVELSSLAMTGEGDLQDSEVQVMLDGQPVGTFPVDNTIDDSRFDEMGRATVSVLVSPRTTRPGQHWLQVAGETTGTSFEIPFRVTKRPVTRHGGGKPAKSASSR